MNATASRLSPDEARALLARIFEAAGATPATALSVADNLVRAEADGLKGHGLSRVPTYLAMLKAGKIDGRAQPALSRPRPGVLAIDAADGFAYPAIDLALAELPALARKTGLALAAISRSNHAGAMGWHVERLARQGLVALAFANTPAAIAPWGGSRGVYGTNPIAFAAPLPGREPAVVDLALSKVARGNLVAARQKGEAIPEGWALDADGNPTTDAAAGLAGTMIAMGDAKGTALAFMVEVLAAALVGAHLGFEASSFLDNAGGPPRTGQLFIAIDPSATTPASMGTDAFAQRMTALAQAIESQPGARLPGQRRLQARILAAQNGLTIPADVLALAG
jgi:(2R)-3-sulfolactate dehydrogenase (NADP+)